METELVRSLAANKDAFLALAAIGALLMSGITAVLSLFGAIRVKKIDVEIKRQEAVRKLIENDMVKIGEAMHETLARASILTKKFYLKPPKDPTELERSINENKKKIDESKAILLNTKTEYRYKFHGLEQGLTAIARAADWIKGMRENPDMAQRFVDEADKIRVIVDEAIVCAYRDGVHASRLTRLRIRYRAWRLKRMWATYKVVGKNGGAVV